MRVAYDIEADGLLDSWTGREYTKVHCIVLRDLDTDEVRCYHESESIQPRHGGLLDALEVLSNAGVRTAHNGLGYDEAILQGMGFKSSVDCFDTLVMSHMLWPEIEKIDKVERRRRSVTSEQEFPSDLVGRHSLEAWGFRFGVHKGTFGKDDSDAFLVFTQDMLNYCVQDTAVLAVLYHKCAEKIKSQGHSAQSVETEHKFAEVLARQMRMGIHFDKALAEKLWREWEEELLEIDERLREKVEPWVERYVTPKRKIEKTRIKEFNPNSRAQVARLYEERYGHKFDETTDSGQWKVDEGVLKSLVLRDLPHAKDIERRFLLQKRISALATSEKGLTWIGAVCNDGRVHPRINHHGAVTSRCTHSAFNITGVPRVTSPFGLECRSLFCSSPGWTLVGGDAKGLELRMFAHYLYPHDGGHYASVVVDGDPHGVHQEYLGFEDHSSMSGRDRTKTFFYAWLYGAGMEKLGRVVVDGIRYVTAKQAVRIGKETVGNLEARWPGLEALRRSLNIHLTGLSDPGYRTPLVRPYLRSLDGRVLKCRSHHSSLNLAFQGGGAVVMKLATVLADQRMQERYTWRDDYGQVIHAHDEIQMDCRTFEIAQYAEESIAWAIEEAGRQLNLRCPLAADTKSGKNWRETH